MYQRIKLKTTTDVVKLSQFATRQDEDWYLVDGNDEECIDAKSIIGVMYGMAKFKQPYLYCKDVEEFPEELSYLKE